VIGLPRASSARRRNAGAGLVLLAHTALQAGGLEGVARAEGPPSPPETAQQIAQSLFDDGRDLMDAGRVAEACTKFAESHRVDPRGGTLLNLAVCHEREGKTATAWTEFRDALSLAIRDGRADRRELAEARIQALAPTLIRLTVGVPPALSARRPDITLDGSGLPPAAWNTAIPVDPGPHQVRVVVGAAAPWETTVTTDAPGKTYRADVPASVADSLPTGEASQGEGRRSVAFWTLLAGAGLSLGASAVTGVMALDADAYVADNCSAARDFCRVPDAGDEASRARTMAWVSTITLGVGLAAGVVAFLLPRERGAASITVAPSRDGATRGIRFTW